MRPNQLSRRSCVVPGIAVFVAITSAAVPVALSSAGYDTHWAAIPSLAGVLVTLLILFFWTLSTKRELRLLASRFDAASETAREYIWEIDCAGRLVFLTKRAEYVFGLKLDELLGESLHEFMPEDEAVRMRYWFSGLLNAPKPFSEVEFRSVHPYSGVRWQQLSGVPILDRSGKLIGLRGVGMDITDRKLVEGAQQEYLELLQTLLDTIPSAIFYKDLEGRYLGCNETLIRWLGRSREQIMGRTDHQLYPGDLADTYRKVDQQLLLDPGRQRYESEFGNIDGARRTALFHTATFRDAKGQVAGLVSVVTDITDRKKSEKELLAAKRAAETASHAKDEFIANMSHEIRTPLTAILGFSDVLLENLTESENFRAAKTIKRNGLHLLEIVSDILDISKIQAGKLHVERVPCSPLQIMAEISSLMSIRAEAKGLPLSVRQEGPLPEAILTDTNRLRQIMVNLIGNAIKFTETGCIDVVVRCLKSDSPGKTTKLEFEVIDTGIGMSSEQIDNVFEPFTQGDSSATRKHGGTGLGLIISYRLAQILGGDVSVSSSLGNGCRFRATIDTGVSDDVRMIEPEEASDEDIELPTNIDSEACTAIKLDCRILLVEDGPDNQRLISFLLRKAGAKVEIAVNGLEGLKMAMPELHPAKMNTSEAGNGKQDPLGESSLDESFSEEVSPVSGSNPHEAFDVILMDMQMPIMDGQQATRRLRQANYLGPIIGISAHTTTDAAETALEAGCDDFLCKPVDRNRLLSSVAHHLACRAVGQQ